MEDSDQNHSECLIKMLAEVEERVESLRHQAMAIQKERENILELLQDMQDHAVHNNLTEVDREDIESTSERLILRCLTVEVSVSTPRNDIQEEAYNAVSDILHELHIKFQKSPSDHSKTVESCLNACLPEPLSSKIDTRFQSKVLDCTVDDQKHIRKKLHNMYRLAQKPLVCNGSVNNQDECNVEVEAESLDDDRTTQAPGDSEATDTDCDK